MLGKPNGRSIPGCRLYNAKSHMQSALPDFHMGALQPLPVVEGALPVKVRKRFDYLSLFHMLLASCGAIRCVAL